MNEKRARGGKLYRKSPSSPLLYGLRDTLSHSCSKTKLNAKKLYIICSFSCLSFSLCALHIRFFSLLCFTPTDFVCSEKKFDFVYYVKRGAVCCSWEWKFPCMSSEFSLRSLVRLQFFDDTLNFALNHAMTTDDDDECSFVVQHRAKESNKRRQRNKNISDLANIFPMCNGKWGKKKKPKKKSCSCGMKSNSPSSEAPHAQNITFSFL